MFDSKGFLLIEDEGTRQRLIREACKDAAQATLWTSGQAVIVKTRLSNFDIIRGTFSTSLPTEFPLEKALSLVSEKGGVFFNVQLSHTHILFKAHFHHFEQGRQSLDFKLPTELYKVQQRKHPRVSTREATHVKLSHEDVLNPGRSVSRKVLDLSAGGLSMRLFAGEERHYRVGQQLKALQLQLGAKTVGCWGSIQNIRVLNDKTAQAELVAGVEFASLDEAEQKIIADYVDRELVKQFGSMMSAESGKKDK